LRKKTDKKAPFSKNGAFLMQFTGYKPKIIFHSLSRRIDLLHESLKPAMRKPVGDISPSIDENWRIWIWLSDFNGMFEMVESLMLVG
jgi:hypothetical protein